jgi:hypothetical protein
MDAEAHDGGAAPEAPAEQVAHDGEAAEEKGGSMQDVNIDPLASTHSGEADAVPEELESSLQAQEDDETRVTAPVDQEQPEETIAPPAPDDTAVAKEDVSAIVPSNPEPGAPQAGSVPTVESTDAEAVPEPTPEPTVPAADSTANKMVSDPTPDPMPEPTPVNTVARADGTQNTPGAMPVFVQSAAGLTDITLEAPRPVSDMGADAGTSQGAMGSGLSNGHRGPTLGGLNGAAPQPAHCDPSYRDIQVVPSEHHGAPHSSSVSMNLAAVPPRALFVSYVAILS